MGISATYFFMLTSNFYNPLSSASRSKIEQIRDLGHTISVHYDPTAHTDLDVGFTIEKDLFEAIFSTKLDIISLHRPQGFLENNNRALPGVRHTYEDMFFRRLHYMSDSRGSFHHGHPLDSDAFANRQPIHLLLHPLWWVNDGETPSDKIRAWQRQHHDFLNEEVGRNCKAYDGRSAHRAES